MKKFLSQEKSLQPSPAEKFAKEYKVGDEIEGEVVNKTDFGVFIKLNDEIDGLIKKEELSPLDLDEIKEGDKIKAEIVTIDPQKNRVRLSHKKVAKRGIKKNNSPNNSLGEYIKEALKKNENK